MMIPKVIHYCWFGHGEKSGLMKKCIKSWKKYCHDYQIIEWNEDNFDTESNIFVKQAYEYKKWAFVSDYVRLYVLYHNGGIYLDTDVELIKPLDVFLTHSAFSGFETPQQLQTGVIAAEKHHKAIKAWLDYYNNREFLVNGQPDKEPNVKYMTEVFLQYGLKLNDQYQEVCDMAIYPQTFFCPLCITSIEKRLSKDTVAIHHFASTWRTKKALKDFARVRRHQKKWYRTMEKLRYVPNKLARKVLGDKTYERLKSKARR